MIKPSLVIYHANCMDGFTAAWAVRRKIGEQDVEYVALGYDDLPTLDLNRFRDHDILMVDFSMKRDQLMELARIARSVVILDHHVSAQRDLSDIPPFELGNMTSLTDALEGGRIAAHFDMQQSGAMLAWKHCFPGVEAPILVHLVQDRDLWRFNLAATRAIHAYLTSIDRTFETWDNLGTGLEEPERLNTAWLEGDVILRYERKLMRELAHKAELVNFAGHQVPALNAPREFSSEIGNMLSVGYPFAIVFSVEGGIVKASFRSQKEGGVDVSVIAEQYGGGGHKNAAGGTIQLSDMERLNG